MKRIGLLSDTHAYWDERYLKYFDTCDEIWHAGDIGSLEVAERLAAFRPLRAVYGNIDGQDLRIRFPEINRFQLEGTDVLIKHIGGYPGKYDPSIRKTLMTQPPKLFISGHSHILKVKYDSSLGLLHINPGAAGKYGFHKVRTLVRFSIENGNFSDLEVIEPILSVFRCKCVIVTPLTYGTLHRIAVANPLGKIEKVLLFCDDTDLEKIEEEEGRIGSDFGVPVFNLPDMLNDKGETGELVPLLANTLCVLNVGAGRCGTYPLRSGTPHQPVFFHGRNSPCCWAGYFGGAGSGGRGHCLPANLCR